MKKTKQGFLWIILAIVMVLGSVLIFNLNTGDNDFGALIKKAVKTSRPAKKTKIKTPTPSANPVSKNFPTSDVQPKPLSPPKSTYGPYSIGYIGCSNTQMSIQGYHLADGNGNRFWPAYNTDGKGMDEWANSSDSAWNSYDQNIKSYGQPAAVWVQICQVSMQNSLEIIKNTIGILKQKSPSAIIYISAINSYSPPEVCPTIGPMRSGLVGLAQQAVQSNLGKTGPDLGPLTQALVTSDYFGTCHPNEDGKKSMGAQLKAFFDTL